MTNPAAGDCRRAAALVAHHGNNNVDGINAVLQEAAEADRVTQLFLAILDLYQTIVPALYTKLGMQALSQTVLDIANREVSDE